MGHIIDIDTNEKLLVPKVICVGRNYAAHAREMNAEVQEVPVLFFKPSTSILHQGANIPYPPYTSNLQHEVELGVVMAKGGKRIQPEEVQGKMYGYLLALDLTLRDRQNEAKREGKPWAVCKGFDGSLPISMVVGTNNLADIQNLDIKLWVNQQLRQSANTSDMIFSVERLVSYISDFFTLERGDLILTGTPAGVSAIEPGDLVEAQLGSRLKISFLVEKKRKPL